MRKNIHSAVQLVLWLSLATMFSLSADAIIFTNDAVIDFNDFSYEGADVVVSNCTVTVDGAHTFASVGVFSGGALTHSNGFMGMSLTVTGNVNVALGGAINVNTKGYFDTAGPGIGGGLGGPSGGGGGGYGGYGGSSSSNSLGGAVYGSFSQPTDFGSPGGGGGGAGGGFVRIAADGTITIDGIVSANGANGFTNRSGGGSGGSIWLTAARIAGSGSITADGGAGEPPHGGGGGGGRIAIEFATNEFSGTLLARGGLGATAGGAGTIYTKGTNQTGLVLVDNGGRAGTNTLLQITNSSDLVVQGKAAVAPSGNQSLRNLLVATNSTMLLSSNQAITAFGDVTVELTGGILADGNGYVAGKGPGAGATLNSGNVTTGGGGGYGGYGSPSAAGAIGGMANGVFVNPVERGSGGGSGNGLSPFNLGGTGGGSIRLNVFGTLRIDGRVSADGRSGPAPGSGGGAGGSIWLTAQTLAGSGTITANGGNGNGSGGGGGGGRIAVSPSTDIFTGNITAFGGMGGAGAGGAGTISVTLFTGGVSRILLAIDNGEGPGGATTLGTGQFSGTLADLSIVNGGALIWPSGSTPGLLNLLIGSNSSLIVTNLSQTTISVTSNVTVQAGGWLNADGASSIGNGQGVSTSAPIYGQIGSGAGHGGLGGTTIVGTPGGGTYGTVSEPSTFGSRGGNASGISSGGAGGGFVRMIVSRTLRVDGKISANGLDGNGLHAGGGSGGSLNLTANTLAGTGTISANGGRGIGVGGGGAGGRVAVTYTSNLFAGVVSAFGANGGGIPGGAGTVYLRKSNSPNPTDRVLVDNAGQSGFTPYAFSTPSSPDFIISGRSILLLTNNFMTFANLSIRSNSVLVVTNNATFALTVMSNVTLEAGSVISADGGGFAYLQGTGAGTTISSQLGITGSGAGYGGIGGNSAGGAAGGMPYGTSMSEPIDRGSGGGGLSSAVGGSGGGALSLNVSRTLLLDGTISANGRSAPGLNGGGGSGGSLWLRAGTLSGSGSIVAHGGNGNASGGGGAGGRISIQYATNLFTGLTAAYGGAGYFPGGPGTVFTKSYSNGVAQVVLEGNSLGATGLAPTTNRYGLTIGNGVTVPVTYSGGATLTLANLFIASGGALAFTNGVQLIALPLFGTLTVEGNATIQAGGLLIADGAGGFPGNGSGGGGTSTASGGGYGGLGVKVGTAFGSGAYGSATQPSATGSGGGPSIAQGPAIGGKGGGVVKVSVNGLLQLDGRISANGLPGGPSVGTSGPNSAGGGSGGSVWLTVGGIAGAGAISANGGDGFNAGGGGGGGRIALYFQTNNFSGAIRAFGGNNGISNNTTVGGAGTIYLAGIRGDGQLIADNGGRLGTNTLVTDQAQGLFDLTVRAGAVYAGVPAYRNIFIGSNGWMLLTNQLITVNSNATIEAGGGIIADGTGFGSFTGTGAGRTSASQTGSGGGYGGYGAASGTASGGTAYLPAASSVSAGSGGGPGVGLGGAGGGVVQLTVAGTLTNDGRISADGTMGDFNAGGGSGGNILLNVGRLSGIGRISANGGVGGGPAGGGGGGGRISITYGVKGQNSATNNFIGILQALGGASGTTNPAGYGGAGTIFISSTVQTFGQLSADNGGHVGTNTLVGGQVLFDLTVRGSAAAVSSLQSTSMRNLLVESNSWFVVSNNLLNISGIATINAGGGVIADGKGYVGGQGPGAGATAFSSFYGNTGGGGGHGGYGAASVAGARGGNTYDFITTFSNGSGGGGIPPNSAGTGGGVVRLNASSLVLNGRISADGGDGVFQHGGGGAGGGVSLSVGAISGNGIISASGGAANGVGGGGGGGRIDLLYSTNNFSGAIRAWGGIGGGGVGGAGTILTRRTGQIDGQLSVANGSLAGTNTPLPILTNMTLTVGDGAIVHPSGGSFVLSNLLVSAGGLVTSFDGQTNLNISVVGNAIVSAGGAIATDGNGFAEASGPGAGLTAGGYGSGAGYGGPGGDSSTAPGGFVYGSALQPTDLGSGGGFGSGPTYPGSQGGGAIRLNIGGTLTVNGRLAANGNAGVQDNAGGGSGGSIWVDTGILNGNGQISADGGDGELYGGGGGGGGRIAIYRHKNASPTNNFTGFMSAFGGEGAQWGGDGTIFLSSGFGTLQVLSQTPAGTVTGAVTFVDLAFSSAVNPNSFSTSDVLLTRGGNVVSNILSVATLSPTSFRVNLQALPVAGDYQIVIGPQIENLYGQTMSQVYTGAFTVVLPVVQGTVTDTNGTPVSGVLLQPSGGFAAATTDANGNYAIGFVPGASFTVTPTKASLMFAPGIRSYINLGAPISNENYIAVDTIAANLTSGINNGMMEVSCYGISGVNYQLFTSTNLVNWLPYGALTPGVNSTILYTVPVGPEPVKFFRVRASN